MRGDVFTEDVLRKCESLKAAKIWRAEPELRPHAWLSNFEDSDKPIAAVLLDRFNFYSDAMTERLLKASYDSLGDGLRKGPAAPQRDALLAALPSALFTRVDAEQPRPTDSGNLLCRKARQVLGIPDEQIVEPTAALLHAQKGGPVVFLDDFVGSGDQFLTTWSRKYPTTPPSSFQEAHAATSFVAIYVSLVATEKGLQAISQQVPQLALSVAHHLDQTSTVRAIDRHPTLLVPNLQMKVETLLRKYAPALTPTDTYIARNPSFKVFGYKNRGLLFAFEHSVPDSTLPIYWSDGPSGWTPLRRRG